MEVYVMEVIYYRSAQFWYGGFDFKMFPGF